MSLDELFFDTDAYDSWKDMPTVLAILVVLVGLAVAVWLAYSALTQVKRLRGELDQTQSQLNETRQALAELRQSLSATQQDLAHTQQELTELKAAAEVLPPPPPLPRARSSGLQDLREQLRAAHREDEPSEE